MLLSRIRVALLFSFLIWFFNSPVLANCGNDKCVCKKISENSLRMQVSCGGTDELRISNWRDIDLSENTTSIIALDLSKNAISSIDSEHLQNFTELKRLDLSSNTIREIENGAFGNGLLNLDRLKLSNNSIGHIYQGAFDNLPNLKLLDISNNPLVCNCDLIWLLAWSNSHMVKMQPAPKCEAPPDFKGTLLKKLKVGLDLHCDSPSQPLLELIPKTNQVVFEGDQLILQCRAPRVAIGIPRDSEDLPPRAHVFWGWSEKIRQHNSTEDIVFQDPTKVFNDVFLNAKHTTDSGILNSILQIGSVTKNHTGTWDCTLRSHQANLSHAIAVIVISKATEYCDVVKVRTNKGVYYWPQTVRGQTVQQMCSEQLDPSLMASYHCSHNGSWVNLKTDDCPFVSETTRILEQFAKVNLTLTKSNVYEIARSLHNFTFAQIQLKRLRDPIDLEFIARTLLHYLDYMKTQHDVAYLMLGIVSQLLELPHSMFYDAQRQYRSGIKLLHAAEMTATYVQSSSPLKQQDVGKLHSVTVPKNFFIDYFQFRVDTFGGITCVWLRGRSAPSRHSFECNTSNETLLLFDKHVDAAIHIPAHALFKESQKFIRLMVAIFRNGHLLPNLNVGESKTYNEITQPDTLLTSALIGTRITDESGESSIFYQQSLSDQIIVLLRPQPFHHPLSAPLPAWWDSGSSTWNSSVCKQHFEHRGLLMFTCSRLGYYGLLQKTSFLNDFANEEAGARFRFLPIGIYVGCTLLFCCCWINIATFVAFGRAVRINRIQRHSLVNTWLALALLCSVFALGIYQTEEVGVCRLFGIAIHYLSLCVLLWICVSMSSMYKRLSKSHRVIMEPDLPKEGSGQTKKPILGVYLVGWGIAMIICGISSAVNIEYASYSFCFLADETTMNAILVPSVILILFLGILFLCIYYHINQRAINVLQTNQFSDNTQATEHIDMFDMDWLDSTHNTARRLTQPTSHGNGNGNGHGHGNNSKMSNMEQYRSLTLSNPLSSIVDDFERSNMAHLRAHFLFLMLYSGSWLSAAAYVNHMATDGPNSNLYSIMFGTFSSILGVFLLIFYTLSRNDTRTEWSSSSCCSNSYAGYKGYDSAYSAAGTAQMVANPAVPYRSPFDSNHSGSRSNSQCSKNRSSSARSLKSNSHKNERAGRHANSNASADGPTQHLLGGGAPSVSAHVINNQHASSLAAAGLTHDIPSAEVFYNPNQINVARKFFKKQKRLAKRNNFELQRHMDRFDCPDNTSDISSLTGGSGSGSGLYSRRHNAMTMTMLSSNSKVNNTNIHYKPQNILGSSKAGPTNGIIEVRIDEVVKTSNALHGRDRLHARPQAHHKANVLANIYTNIPETTAPQHEVVKMRGPTRSSRPKPVEPLTEHEELELENEFGQNSCNGDSVGAAITELTPLYENTNGKQIQQTTQQLQNHAQLHHSTPAKPAVRTETSFLAHTEVEAMNNLGLPEPDCIADMSGTHKQEESEEEAVGGRDDEEENTPPDLQRDEIYVSNSLQITTRVAIDENFSSVLIRIRQLQSKSLNNLDDIFSGAPSGGKQTHQLGKYQSTSSNDLPRSTNTLWHKSQAAVSAQTDPAYEKNFSPRKFQRVNDVEVGQLVDDANCFNLPHSRTLSASPTAESDLNYQNSEISIRSHGVYAPQVDNDLNLTLTDDFPYQSSNASEIDDVINDFDEDFLNFGHHMNNDLDANDMDPTTAEAMNTSIDELYEAIKRRSPLPLSVIIAGEAGSRCPLIGSSNTSLCDSFLPVDKTDHDDIDSTAAHCSTRPLLKENLNDTLEDDSSQSSVISYIDPKEMKT